MNLYLLTNINYVPAGSDKYDSAVVAAKSVQEARMIHPSKIYGDGVDEWDGSTNSWSVWCNAEDVIVKHIGRAAKTINQKGVICASFNAA